MTPDENGEYPYDPTETYSDEDLARAKHFRMMFKPSHGRPDRCPHAPVCPNMRVCLESIAWYLRHYQEIEK